VLAYDQWAKVGKPGKSGHNWQKWVLAGQNTLLPGQ